MRLDSREARLKEKGIMKKTRKQCSTSQVHSYDLQGDTILEDTVFVSEAIRTVFKSSLHKD